MANSNATSFNQRVKRIESQHRRAGLDDEAPARGGRGRRRSRGRVSIAMPLLVVVLLVFGLKAAIYNHLGPELYQARLTELGKAQGLERYGAVVMMADPLTIYLAAKIRPYMH